MKALVLIAAVLAVSCSNNGSGGSNAGPSAPQPPAQPQSEESIVGEWFHRGCFGATPFSKSEQQQRFYKEDGTMVALSHHFSDANCSEPSILIRFTGTYQTPNGTGSDPRPFDVTFATVEVEPLSTEGARALANVKLCGITDGWKKDVRVDVTDVSPELNCYQMPFTSYIMHAVRGDRLLISNMANGDPQKRPTDLSISYELGRQR